MRNPLQPTAKTPPCTAAGDLPKPADAELDLRDLRPPMDRPDFSSREFRPMLIAARPTAWLVPVAKRPEHTPTLARTVSGEIVQTVEFVDHDDAPYAPISVSAMRAWLRGVGFIEKPWWGNAEWGIPVRDDIGVEIQRDDRAPDDVSLVIVAFDLCRAAPQRIPAWHQNVIELCEKWPLRLYDRNNESFCDVAEFPSLIQRERAWLWPSGCSRNAPQS